MASGPHRPGWYLGVLITGFLTGGFLTALLRRWLPESGRELRGAPALEFYLNSPQMTPAAELLTRICLPLEATS